MRVISLLNFTVYILCLPVMAQTFNPEILEKIFIANMYFVVLCFEEKIK